MKPATSLKFGDPCRACCTAPARYLKNGLCMYVSSLTNELVIDKAAPATGNEESLPLPTKRELMAASEALYYAKHHPEVTT